MKLPGASDPSGHEATSVVQFEFIQHISLIGKFKMLGCGKVSNSSCMASVIWLSHNNWVDENNSFLANKPDGANTALMTDSHFFTKLSFSD